MTTLATDKINHHPNAWGRLAAWPALVAPVGQRLAARVSVGSVASVLALIVWSGVWLSSFGAESTPQTAEAGGAAEVVNKAQVTPFILVVKTDQMKLVKVSGADEKKTKASRAQIDSLESFLLTSGPDQFQLPLHPFAHYDFTIDWGDGKTDIVKSNAPVGQAIVDENWLAEVKEGLEQTVTFKTVDRHDRYDSDESLGIAVFDRRLMFSGIENEETKIERYLRYLLETAGIYMCENIYFDPKVREKAELQRVEALVSKQKFGTMKLSEVFDQLTKVTGLTYTLHDRALFITESKDLPLLMRPQHTYAEAGTYTVKITENVIGGFPQIYFNGGYDCVKVMDLAQWGGNTWVSLDAAFMGCANMTIGASDAATAVTGAVKDFSKAWSDCFSVTSFPLLNTSAGTNFAAAWYGCSGLTSFPLLNTSAGTNFDSAWLGCSGLMSLPLLNIAAGTNFCWAWRGCSGLTNFPLLNTSVGTDFGSAWRGCSGLTNFPLLNTSAGTDFGSAWRDCSGLTNFPLLNTSAGTNFEAAWSGCLGLINFPLLDVSAGTNFECAWYCCPCLTSFPLLDVSAGTNFECAWSYCSGLTSFPLLDTSAGTNFSWAWPGCSGLTNFPLLNTSAGTNFGGAWSGCSGLTNFPLLDTSAGTDFSCAWRECSGLTNFPLLNFGKMKKTTDCFSGDTLTSASYGELLSNIAGINNVSNVEFDGGFSNAKGLIGIQAREKLTKKLGWTIFDGDNLNPNPLLKKAQPAEIQPQPEEANSF
jgi:hypothetical protein